MALLRLSSQIDRIDYDLSSLQEFSFNSAAWAHNLLGISSRLTVVNEKISDRIFLSLK